MSDSSEKQYPETEAIVVAQPEWLPLSLLGELLDDIYNVTGLQASISSCVGERLVRRAYPNPVCDAFYGKGKEKFHEKCTKCTMLGTIRAVEKKGIYSFRCYNGLMVSIVPIFVDAQPVATIVISSYRTDQAIMETLDKITVEPIEVVDDEALSAAPFIDYQRIQDVFRVVPIFIKYLSESVKRMQMEKKLSESHLEAIAQAHARSEAERRSSQAEFKALQAQINPHFLFNTLNSISQIALLEGANKAPEALYSLAALLRGSLGHENIPVTLEDELSYISEYIKIKELLFRDRIQVLMDIDETCLSLRLPHLTLQPFIENAFIHGLEPKEKGGTLWITIKHIAEFIHIEIKDDGIGFDTTSELLLARKASLRGNITGIGIGNVSDRLASFFGSAFQCQIESSVGHGTCATLMIPCADKNMRS